MLLPILNKKIKASTLTFLTIIYEPMRPNDFDGDTNNL